MNLLKSNEKKIIRASKQSDFKTIQDLVNSSKRPNSLYFKSTQLSDQKCLDLNCREPKFQMTPLMIASLKGSKDIVIFLIKNGANLSLKDIKGNTALQLACMKQRFHIIDALLQNNANPNDVNISGWSCLISAVNYFHEDSSNMLLLLLQTGAIVEHKDNNGLTCVDHAIRKNKTKNLRVIINFYPLIAQKSIRALIHATIKGNLNIILILLNYGIDPNQVELVNGTGPLHEAVRFNDIHDENTRLERLKIVKCLANYGANPDLVNLRNETPKQLAKTKPKHIEDRYMKAMKVYYTEEPKEPKYVKICNNLLIPQIPAYPLLKPSYNWTRNDPKFCSNYVGNDLVTNLIDGNPFTFWTSPGQAMNWVIFDLKAEHLITRIRIYCWRSKDMPLECFLQVSNCAEGPWNCVHKFRCEMIGSSLRTNAGVPMDFDGCFAISRFWRLIIAKNHGGQQTSFHGLEFYGYDFRISKLIEELKLSEYEEMLIENDLNQIESIVNCTLDHFEKLPIYDMEDKEKLWDFISEFQKKAQAVKKLEWFNEPVAYGLVDRVLPPFSIVNSTYLIDSLQIICYGGGIINGDTCVEMEPGGINDPSMAIFRNISFANSGKFLIEVRSLNYPEISLTSQPIQIFNANDPEYHVLISSHSRLNNESLMESEEETFNQSYYFPDFKFDHSSRFIFNKWSEFNQSQDDIPKQAELLTQQFLSIYTNSFDDFYLKKSSSQIDLYSETSFSNWNLKYNKNLTTMPIIDVYDNTSIISTCSTFGSSIIEFEEQELVVEFDEAECQDKFYSHDFPGIKNSHHKAKVLSNYIEKHLYSAPEYSTINRNSSSLNEPLEFKSTSEKYITKIPIIGSFINETKLEKNVYDILEEKTNHLCSTEPEKALSIPKSPILPHLPSYLNSFEETQDTNNNKSDTKFKDIKGIFQTLFQKRITRKKEEKNYSLISSIGKKSVFKSMPYLVDEVDIKNNENESNLFGNELNPTPNGTDMASKMNSIIRRTLFKPTLLSLVESKSLLNLPDINLYPIRTFENTNSSLTIFQNLINNDKVVNNKTLDQWHKGEAINKINEPQVCKNSSQLSNVEKNQVKIKQNQIFFAHKENELPKIDIINSFHIKEIQKNIKKDKFENILPNVDIDESNKLSIQEVDKSKLSEAEEKRKAFKALRSLFSISRKDKASKIPETGFTSKVVSNNENKTNQVSANLRQILDTSDFPDIEIDKQDETTIKYMLKTIRKQNDRSKEQNTIDVLPDIDILNSSQRSITDLIGSRLSNIDTEEQVFNANEAINKKMNEIKWDLDHIRRVLPDFDIAKENTKVKEFISSEFILKKSDLPVPNDPMKISLPDIDIQALNQEILNKFSKNMLPNIQIGILKQTLPEVSSEKSDNNKPKTTSDNTLPNVDIDKSGNNLNSNSRGIKFFKSFENNALPDIDIRNKKDDRELDLNKKIVNVLPEVDIEYFNDHEPQQKKILPNIRIDNNQKSIKSNVIEKLDPVKEPLQAIQNDVLSNIDIGVRCGKNESYLAIADKNFLPELGIKYSKDYKPHQNKSLPYIEIDFNDKESIKSIIKTSVLPNVEIDKENDNSKSNLIDKAISLIKKPKAVDSTKSNVSPDVDIKNDDLIRLDTNKHLSPNIDRRKTDYKYPPKTGTENSNLLPDVDIVSNKHLNPKISKEKSVPDINISSSIEDLLPNVDIIKNNEMIDITMPKETECILPEINIDENKNESSNTENISNYKNVLPDIDINKDELNEVYNNSLENTLLDVNIMKNENIKSNFRKILKPKFPKSDKNRAQNLILEPNTNRSHILPDVDISPNNKATNDESMSVSKNALPNIDIVPKNLSILYPNNQNLNLKSDSKVNYDNHISLDVVEPNALPSIDILLVSDEKKTEEDNKRHILPEFDICKNYLLEIPKDLKSKHVKKETKDIQFVSTFLVHSNLPEIDIQEEENALKMLEDATEPRMMQSSAESLDACHPKSGLLKFQRKSSKTQKSSPTATSKFFKNIKDRLSIKITKNKKNFYSPYEENIENHVDDENTIECENFTLKAKRALTNYQNSKKQ